MENVKKSKSEWQSIRKDYLESLRHRGPTLRLRNRVWAVTDDEQWVALPGVTATSNPDLWWLGIMRDEYREREALGVILLCASADEPLRDFGLPADFLAEVEPHLSLGSERPQLYFTVIRRRSRFELQLRGGRGIDITERLGDLSWIARGERRSVTRGLSSGHSLAAETAPAYNGTPAPAKAADEIRFFARASETGLDPVDPVRFERDAMYLVRATRADDVPSSGALRRILARGGPDDLPRDLAAQHDHYSHGGPKR